MAFKQNVLLCYRGRYKSQVESLAAKLRSRGLSVSYDHEILAGASSIDVREVDWISLTAEEKDADTSWRAPLRDAIQSSELSVFLIDPHDPSNNVVNEIAWVAKSGRHAFYILDTRSETVTPDAEGIYVSFLNVICAMALHRFEVAGFEYLLFAHADPRELDARLDVAVNRIEDYLERVRVRPPDTVHLDSDITLADVENSPLARARRRLGEIQEQIYERLHAPPPPHSTDAYQDALEFAFRYEKGATIEGDFIRPPGSPYRFPLRSERRRFLRTQRLIERVRPGRYELVPLLPLLARQAASIELSLQEASGFGKSFEPPVLFGTLPMMAASGAVSVLMNREYAIILLDAAFLDFVYQITKVSVCSWKRLPSGAQGGSSFSSMAGDVAEVIQANPSLAQGFFRCLQAYAVKGSPAASTDSLPDQPYHAPISTLTASAERFLLGRGYAELALTDPDFPAMMSFRDPPANERDRLLRTDQIATASVLASSAALDRIDPAIALQGCGLPALCADLIRRVGNILEPAATQNSSEEPLSLQDRLSAIESAYVAAAMSAGARRERAAEGLGPARLAWQTVELLWEGAKHRFEEERSNGARLAWMWR